VQKGFLKLSEVFQITLRRFRGLYVHICNRETPHEAYRIAKNNDGALMG
jgi:hypothetical protein